MREKSRDFLGLSYDFFHPHARLDAMEFDLVRTFRRPPFEHAKGQGGERADRFGLFGVFEDFAAGVVFLFHVYTLPQNGQKARDFFAILQIIFVDNPSPFLKKFERSFYF